MNDANPLFDGPIDAPDIEVLPPRGTASRRGLLGIAESRLLDLAEDGKTELARSFDGFVAMARELADSAERLGGGALGGYAQQAASLLSDVQAGLRDTPVEDLLDDGRELIRQSPRLTIGVAVVAGFVVARLVKSSAR